jgi:hypothetical protein
MGDLSDFERRQIVVACLAGASVTNCHIIRCNQSGIYRPCEDNVSEEEQWAKDNIDRKRTSFIEKDCFEKLQYGSTGKSEMDIYLFLKTLFPQKLSDPRFTNPTSTVGLQLLNL